MDETKSPTKPSSERKEAIFKTVERRDACKKRAAQVVEEMLEDPVSEGWLLKVVHDLSQQDYQDAVEERAILRLCGYPLCSRQLTQMPKQKYHICMKSRKVYDITYRKQYCSDVCYRASEYLKGQLWEGPLWLRDEAEVGSTYKLYVHENEPKRNVRGEEIDFGRKRIAEKDIEFVREDEDADKNEQGKPSTITSPRVTTETLNKLAEQIDKVNLGTHAVPDSMMRKEVEEAPEPVTPTILGKTSAAVTGNDAEAKVFRTVPRSLDSASKSEKRNQGGSATKGQKQWRSMLESEQCRNLSSGQQAAEDATLPAERAEHVLRQWMTSETLELLIGSEAAKRFRLHHQTAEQARQAERYRDLYSKLCKKLDEEEKIDAELDKSLLDSDDDDDDENSMESRSARPTAPLPTMEQLRRDPNHKRLMICERHVGESDVGPRMENADKVVSKKATRGRKVPAKTKQEEVVDVVVPDREPVLPLVDTHSQKVHRRRIVLDHLKKVLPDILDLLYLDLPEISSYLVEFVLTLRLAPDNITFTNDVWIHIAVCVLFMLSRRCAALQSAMVMEDSKRRFSLYLLEMGSSEDAVQMLVDRILSS